MSKEERSVTNQAIGALREAYEENNLEVPFDLVKRCYEIEKDFQFISESESPRRRIEGMIEEHIDQNFEAESSE